jgi:hypothetical protein
MLSAASYVEAIAAQTLDASRVGLDNAKRDSGVLYAFYLLTQVTLASRHKNWEEILALHGIRLASDSTAVARLARSTTGTGKQPVSPGCTANGHSANPPSFECEYHR